MLQPPCWEAPASSADPSPDSLLRQTAERRERLPPQNTLTNFFFCKSPAPIGTSLSTPLCGTWTCSAEAETWSPRLLECCCRADEGPQAGRSVHGGFGGSEKLNWCLSASPSPLNYSSADGAPETTALEGSQNAVQEGFCEDAEKFRGRERRKKMGIFKNRLKCFSAVVSWSRNPQRRDCDTCSDIFQSPDCVTLSLPGKSPVKIP